MKFIKSGFDTIKAAAFWGLFSLIILLTLFDINLNTILNEAKNGLGNCKTICIFFLIAGPAYVVLGIISIIIEKISASEYPENFKVMVLANIEIVWRIPFKGLFPKGLLTSIRKGYFFKGDSFAYILGFLRSALWWMLAIWIYITINGSDNEILAEANRIPHDQQIRLIMITGGIIVAGNIIITLLTRIMMAIYLKHQRGYSYVNDEVYKGYVPVGCRACGGPYPKCRTSCNLYDD